jgi:histidinol-phosphate aminotransferase
VAPRAALGGIALYAPDAGACAVDLSENTNLWGAPPAAERAVREALARSMPRYPTVYAHELKAAIAAYVGVSPDEVVTGCGSDDVIDCAIRAFAEPGDRIAYQDPSFVMVPVFGRLSGLELRAVPLTEAYDLDADALLAAGARVTYLCSPNNPTGTAVSRAAIERVVREASGLVILDEAYAEFADDCLTAEAPAAGRLLVTRTMSKAFGLAGLRVGYGVGARALVAEVEKARGPYKVNALAERAALAGLAEDVAWVREHAALARANRARFAEALGGLGLAALPSAANFVLVPVRGAADVARRMRALGVAVRAFGALPPVSAALRASGGGALRITVGPWELMERALDALASAIGGAAGRPAEGRA